MGLAALGGLAAAAAAATAFGPDLGQGAQGAAHAALAGLGLTVQDVTVSGRRNALSHEILAALHVDRGDSMFDFDAGRARARVLDVDWIEDATVARLFPDTIHVTIVERKPFAVWQKSGRNYVIDDSGATITEASPAVMAQLPYIIGEGAPEAAPKLFAMLARRPAIRDRVRAAVRVGQRRWTLQLRDGVEVMLPAARAEAALDELIQLEDRTGILDRKVRSVDLRIPDRLTVRPRDDAEAADKGDTNT